MARDLGDVLHYFLGESQPAPEGGLDTPVTSVRTAPLRLVAVPLGSQDVVRAALVWNLAVEIARSGAAACVVAPAGEETEALWPEPGKGPLGAELVLTFAESLADLAHSARDVASTHGATSREGGLVLVRVPPAWLPKVSDAGFLFEWTLCLTSPDARDLLETYGWCKRVLQSRPEARVGVTIHGPRSIEDARRAFERLDGAAGRHLGRALTSYGLLVDDVHVYRAIVSRRPVGLTHPRAAATRALQDVARLLLEDAREGGGG